MLLYYDRNLFDIIIIIIQKSLVIINKDKKYYDIEMCFYISMYNILLNIIILKLNKN